MADVHGDLGSVVREAAECDVLLVLGDLINIIDYEDGSGVLSEVYGADAVQRWIGLRAGGDAAGSRRVLQEAAAGREEEMHALLLQRIDAAHRAFCAEVPSNVLLTYGNVDVPDLIRRYLPDGPRFCDAEVVDLDGIRFGFVGGGLPKVGIPGEVAPEDYERKVRSLGDVDVLCSHIPPAVEDLTYDVVARLNEPGSTALLEYIEEHEPGHVYFGHVHQPKVASIRLGSSVLVNVGHHYRSTGTSVEHPVRET